MQLFLRWVAKYGYLALFGLLTAGVVGAPVPDETLLTFAGVLVYRGHLEFWPAVAVAFAGSACGISVSYAVGNALGLLLLRRHGRYFRLTPERFDRAHAWFERVGRWSLFFGYFLPGIRHLTALLAGATRLRFREFAAFAYPGALLWSFTFISLGVLAGHRWAQVSEEVHHSLTVGSAIVAAVLLAAWLGKTLRDRVGRRPG